MNRESIKLVLSTVGARKCKIPEHIFHRINSSFALSRHYFSFRVRGEVVVWFEVWCNNEGVISHIDDHARKVAAKGFKVLFLPTQFSVRDVGQRRPCLITPIETQRQLKRIAELLVTSRSNGFVAGKTI